MIKHHPAESVDFPSYNSLRNIMSRCALKNRPSDPTIETIETFVIPLEFRTTLGENGADFVLHRACVPNPGHTNKLEGYIVIGDVQILENLFNSTVVATDDCTTSLRSIFITIMSVCITIMSICITIIPIYFRIHI